MTFKLKSHLTYHIKFEDRNCFFQKKKKRGQKHLKEKEVYPVSGACFLPLKFGGTHQLWVPPTARGRNIHSKQGVFSPKREHHPES